MLINYLLSGQIDKFILGLFAIILSLSLHEFGHAWTAKYFGDNTAQRNGRLTLNPIAHLDLMGLVMVATVGIGYAKPVPTDPRNYRSPYAAGWVAAAGPLMNLVLAFIVINLFVFGANNQVAWLRAPGTDFFFQYMAVINVLLMLFNLLPIGLLDGHYILPYFLSRNNAIRYVRWNEKYGNLVLFSLIILSFAGVPVFQFLQAFSESIFQYLVIV